VQALRWVNTTRVAVIGWIAGGASRLKYSDDLGRSWTESNMSTPDFVSFEPSGNGFGCGAKWFGPKVQVS